MNILSFSSIISMFFECIFSLPFLFKDRVLIFFLSPMEPLIQAAIKYASNCAVIFFSLFPPCEMRSKLHGKFSNIKNRLGTRRSYETLIAKVYHDYV